MASDLRDIGVGGEPGRQSDDGITVFDSTGLAIQDVAAAHVAYENATRAGDGTDFELLQTE
jgi:alanine dehydrogenase